jgi:hypothetical protein
MALILGACQMKSLTSSIFGIKSGSVLFQDDFSDPGSGWKSQIYEQSGILDYFDGFYRVQVNGSHSMLWTGPDMNFSDVHIEADSIKVIGSPDDSFGLVCRAIDQENYYFLVISSDGYYGIGKVSNGIQELINMPGMLPSEIITQGKSKNHLRADCIGDRLDLYANGQLLASVSDLEYTNGKVGLIVGTLEASQNVVLFDNFSVLKP